MKEHVVEFAPEALDDLRRLYDWIADAASPAVALTYNYITRIETFCRGMAFSPERGHRRDDIRLGLRIVGFERRITIAFTVSAERVTILRLFYGGRDWEGPDRMISVSEGVLPAAACGGTGPRFKAVAKTGGPG